MQTWQMVILGLLALVLIVSVINIVRIVGSMKRPAATGPAPHEHEVTRAATTPLAADDTDADLLGRDDTDHSPRTEQDALATEDVESSEDWTVAEPRHAESETRAERVSRDDSVFARPADADEDSDRLDGDTDPLAGDDDLSTPGRAAH